MRVVQAGNHRAASQVDHLRGGAAMAHHVFHVAHGEKFAIGDGDGGRQRLRPVDRVETAVEQDGVCVHGNSRIK
ncbi:hypothetical protein D3C87_1656710 [compost metagenome]